MKKIIGLSAIVIAFLVLFSMMSSPEVTAPEPTPATLPTQFTMTVPETDFNVTISSYTGNTVEYGDFEGNPQAGYGSVTMMPQFLSTFKNGYVGTFAVSYGGSGEMIYLGYFAQGEASHQLESYVLLGDRVDVTNLSVNGESVTVTYNEHGPEQALAEVPNVQVVETYKLIGNKLVKTKS